MRIFIKLKLFFMFLCFFQGSSNLNAKWLSLVLDSTQAKNDTKEVVSFTRQEAETLIKSIPSILLDEANKPENKEKLMNGVSKILPKDIVKYLNGSEQDKQAAITSMVKELNSFKNAVGKEAENQGLYENVMPSPWYLARYGFIFGAAVFAGFNGLYYIQQAVKDYLAIRKPKYISPLSNIGVFDQYKQLVKTWIYGFKKHKHDDEAQIIVSRLQGVLLMHENEKKQYNNFFIRDNLAHDNTRLFAIVAQKLDMDFIAIPSINLLQKNNIVELWNELVQLIHKNNRSVLLYIDQAELLSMDGTEYSEREENIRILASCVKSSMAVFKSKCTIVGLSRNQEDLQGPFTKIFTKHFVL